MNRVTVKPTRDDVIKWAKLANVAKYGLGFTAWEGQLERFASIAYEAGRLDEREACAVVCEEHPDGLNFFGGNFVACAKAIRLRK